MGSGALRRGGTGKRILCLSGEVGTGSAHSPLATIPSPTGANLALLVALGTGWKSIFGILGSCFPWLCCPGSRHFPSSRGLGHLWIICVGIEAHPGNRGLLESAKGMGIEEKPARRSLLHNPAPGRIPEPRYPRAVPGIAGILWNTGKFFWPLRFKEEGEMDRAA